MSVKGSGKIDQKSGTVIVADVDVPGLYVKRVEIGADGARDMVILGALPQDEDGADIRIEDVEGLISTESGQVGGRRIKVTMDAGHGKRQTLIHARIVGLNPVAQGRSEGADITALGLDFELRTEKVFGVWARDSDDVATHLQATPCVFNPDGAPNADVQILADDLGDLRVCFNLDAKDANPNTRLWDAGRMARYLASSERKHTVNDEPRVFEAGAENVGGELTSFEPFDVNVEGESIWDGLRRVGHLCAHSVVMDYGDEREDCTVRFFRRTLEEEADPKSFEFPVAGGPISITDRGRVLSSIDAQADYSGVVNQIDAVGPPKLYEDTFTLKRGWRPEDMTAARGSGTVANQISSFIRETNPETSSDWERFQHVGRRWILDETGRDDTDPVNEDPYDFSGLFGVDKYAVRYRPFERERAEKDDQGVRKPVVVKVTHRAASSLPTEIEVGQGVVLLDDRAGVVFTDRPMIDPLSALEGNDIEFLIPETVKITAAVSGDQAQPFGVFGSNMKDLLLPTFGLVRLGEAFRTDNISDSSDVEDKAQALVDEAAKEAGERKEVGTYVCPYITTSYQVGDVVTTIDGRGMTISGVIMKIGWDFMTQETQFALQVPELDVATHGLDGQTMVGAGVDVTTDHALMGLPAFLDQITGMDDVFRLLHDPEGRALFRSARGDR